MFCCVKGFTDQGEQGHFERFEEAHRAWGSPKLSCGAQKGCPWAWCAEQKPNRRRGQPGTSPGALKAAEMDRHECEPLACSRSKYYCPAPATVTQAAREQGPNLVDYCAAQRRSRFDLGRSHQPPQARSQRRGRYRKQRR